MTVGERIKAARNEKKLTQNELAGRLGITPALIGHYERGERNPKKETLDKIADALEVSGIYLLHGESAEEIDRIRKNFQDAVFLDLKSDGLVSILAEIYGGAEKRFVDENALSQDYTFFGRGKDGFVLCNRDLETLRNAIKGLIHPIVENMKLTEREFFEKELIDVNSMIKQNSNTANTKKYVDHLIAYKQTLEEWITKDSCDDD